jgi:hypothetical protein
LLSHLQTYRRPDLYQADWNCILCHQDKETWSHLWVCSTLVPLLKTLLDDTKRSFEKHITKSPKSQSCPISSTWHNLPCWQLLPANQPLTSITFESLIRGFIPIQLSSHLSLYFNKKDTLNIIGKVITDAIESFKTHIWKFRCEEFARFEHHMGITQSMKSQKSSVTPNPTINSNSTTSRSHSSSLHPHPDWHKSWIFNSLEAGSVNKWMDFHTHINSLLVRTAD